jgi:hypothetical protein
VTAAWKQPAEPTPERGHVQLLNFKLKHETGAIILHGLGLEWDLHNFAEFAGFRFDASPDSLVLRWDVGGDDNPWGCLANHATGCELVFRGVRFLHMEPGDNPLGGNDTCIAGVYKSIPGETKFRFKKTWGADETFYLVFDFISGREIEIDADTVELVAIT